MARRLHRKYGGNLEHYYAQSYSNLLWLASVGILNDATIIPNIALRGDTDAIEMLLANLLNEGVCSTGAIAAVTITGGGTAAGTGAAGGLAPGTIGAGAILTGILGGLILLTTANYLDEPSQEDDDPEYVYREVEARYMSEPAKAVSLRLPRDYFTGLSMWDNNVQMLQDTVGHLEFRKSTLEAHGYVVRKDIESIDQVPGTSPNAIVDLVGEANTNHALSYTGRPLPSSGLPAIHIKSRRMV